MILAISTPTINDMSLDVATGFPPRINFWPEQFRAVEFAALDPPPQWSVNKSIGHGTATALAAKVQGMIAEMKALAHGAD